MYHEFCEKYLIENSSEKWEIPAKINNNKSEGGKKFELVSDYHASGDQPEAIKGILKSLDENNKDQILLGVTGSGKTFTMANIIANSNRPALIMAHNKTLAAQLYQEFKSFFPHNAVEYFVSYYDYYQPEAYVPRTDTYIEKDSSINEIIDRMRHSATRAVLERDDVIIVSSVSSIYGIGSPETYLSMSHEIKVGEEIGQREIIKKFTELQYERNNTILERGNFRVRGDIIQIFPAHMENKAWQISLFGDEVDAIYEIDPLTGELYENLSWIKIYANSHYVTPRPTITEAMKEIKIELRQATKMLLADNLLLEEQRLRQRTNFDLESLEVTGICKGIENYSKYLSGRDKGMPPPTLFEYLPENTILFVDESHQTIPQIGGMFKGDISRKSTLAKFGFRLPSCMDNRPLKFEEWNKLRPQTVYVSATPGKYELEQTKGEFFEQVIRPTGLIEPKTIIRPVLTSKSNQVDDIIHECKNLHKNDRALITTLTKKMSEDLSKYFDEQGLKARYMHSDIDTLERMEIIRDLRLGKYNILIGINLLREGLDIPECSLVAILDADKEGFLRSETSLIQTIGRAARNVNGRVILYADKITGSIERAIAETNRRREKQIKYNEENNITPSTIKSKIAKSLYEGTEDYSDQQNINNKKSVSRKNQLNKYNEKDIEKLRKKMLQYANDLEFEKAAEIRDEINFLLNSQVIN